MWDGQRKNPRKLSFSIIHAANSICIACPRSMLKSIWWLSDHLGRSGFPGRSGFLGLFGRSSFPVILAFWSFQLSGHFSFLRLFRSLQSKEF
jgi:hypothetical protein